MGVGSRTALGVSYDARECCSSAHDQFPLWSVKSIYLSEHSLAAIEAPTFNLLNSRVYHFQFSTLSRDGNRDREGTQASESNWYWGRNRAAAALHLGKRSERPQADPDSEKDSTPCDEECDAR